MATTEDRINQRICPECGEDFGPELEYCPVDGTRLRSFTMRTGGDEVDPLLGRDIDGRFSVDRVLGEGGMGKVYAGKQLSVNRDVAIKVLRNELANDEKIVKRFFREAQVISQFSHPNIVSLVDFGQDVENDILYLAMEFIDGTELSGLVSRHRFLPPFAVELMIQVCEALSEPHEVGVIHRDLKPENIMLLPRSDGRVQAKVVDFGIAHAIQNETKLTQTGSVFGTVHYMAPEQAQGNPVASYTDIYALGCILFELLTGSVPFDGETAMQLLMAHVQGTPPVLAHFLPAGPETDELSELVLQMMRKSGDERPASVLEVRDRLEQIQRTYNHPRVKIDLSVQGDRMYAQWLAESIDVHSGAGTMERQTNAPVSAHTTDENQGLALDDTMAQEPESLLATSPQAVAATNHGQAVSTQTVPAHVTGLTDLAVPSRNKKLIPLLALGFLGMVVVVLGLAVMVTGGGDEEVVGSDTVAAGESGEAAALAAVEDEPAEEEPIEEEPAAEDEPAEEAPIEEEPAEEAEVAAEEAPQEEVEPEPVAAPPRREERQVREEPAPQPQRPARRAAEPEPEEEEPTQRRRMNIFTVD